MRHVRRRALLFLMLPTLSVGANELPQSSTVFGNRNALLADGSAAMQAGRYDEGIRLTLAGLDQPNDSRDAAAGHSNLCAAYATLRRWDEALAQCNRSLSLDRSNWRTFNNRAAVYVGKGLFELAVADINSGLELAPESATLLMSREIVEAHRRANRDRQRKAVKA
jgi:tetratricopeptide (TPR) repeat protein